MASALVLASVLLPLGAESAQRETRTPRYEPARVLRHAEGVVVLTPCMSDGARLCVSRSSGNPALDAAARSAAESWMWHPHHRERAPEHHVIPVFLPPGCAQA